MIIFETLEEIRDVEPTAVALGNFDGVHLGHQKLIEKAVEKAKEDGLKSAVFTFSNHPKNLLPKEKRLRAFLQRMKRRKLSNPSA